MKKLRAPTVTSIAALGMLALAPSADAADHLDSPAAQASPAADITDVYAWVDGPNTINLIMNVIATTFSDSVQYVLHVESGDAYGATGNEVNIICQFDASQTIECWAGDEDYVKGDASDPVGLAGQNGKFKVFAGARNDPFYFNISGFNETIDIVKGAASSLTFNDAGCPALDSATSSALVGQLSSEPGGGAAVDDFAAGKVGSIVIQIDKDVIAKNGDVLAVWGSTNQR